VTDFAVAPRHRWLIYAQQVGETFNEDLEWVRLSSDAKPPAFAFEAPLAVRSLAWSPSGDQLALVITSLKDETRDVRAGTGLDQLWVLSLEDGQQERIVPQNPGDTVDWRWLHWSQDGRYLFGNRFLPDGSGPPVLYALNLSTYRLQRIGEGKKVLDQNRQGALLLGPLGEGTRGQLWRLDNLTSTRSVSMTPPNRSDWGGRWSPSGDKIIFSSSKNLRSGGSNSLWLMNSDGSNRRQLTEGANDGLAWWLPGGEGDYVLFIRDRFELHLLEIETGKTRQILLQANVDYVPVSLHN
jgi:dipeptidyl aminopeptidase/acylaminoacyl peptidase